MPNFKDITSQQFGRLTALYRLHNYPNNRTYWLCACECGNLKEAEISNLLKGHIRSCGCLRKELNTIHGKHDTRLYYIYNSMKDRCYNQNNNSYVHYGGRGIKICDEWLHDFDVFYNWAINNGYNDTLTIDRIDVNGNYEPSNCKWSNRKQQARNTTRNRYITINGETHCLSEWCEILGLKYKRVHNRLNKHGWSIERALELEN